MFKELNSLMIFFEEPEREFHLREISRLVKKNPVTVKKNLEEFIKKNILSRKKERGLELYSSNTEDKNYKELKKTYNKFRIFESGLIDFLNDKFNLPVIILFGSFEKGEDNKNSDVDIFILSEVKENFNLARFEKKINRKIQIHLMNQNQFNKNKRDNSGLINSILNGNVLAGYLEVL